MGVKGNYRDNERLKTKLNLHKAPLCANCPARLYQSETSKLLYGKGNMSPEYMFVLPKIAIMNEIYEKLLAEVCEGIINLDEQYITYHEKCYSVKESSEHCKQYLFHEIRQRVPTKIIFFGVDIPEELLESNWGAQIYKFYDLYSIIRLQSNKDIIRAHLKKTL